MVDEESAAEEEEATAPEAEDQQDHVTAEAIAEVQLDEIEPAWQSILWAEFKTTFRTNFVSAGTMRMKKNEFRALKQGHMSVNEYLTKFNQLARYAQVTSPTKKRRWTASWKECAKI